MMDLSKLFQLSLLFILSFCIEQIIAKHEEHSLYCQSSTLPLDHPPLLQSYASSSKSFPLEYILKRTLELKLENEKSRL
jgi:hypothetical protein